MSEETKNETALALTQPKTEAVQAWELLQRRAKAFADSDLVPADYKKNSANCIVALEMASRLGASEMAVMQNLHVISGRPSWSSQFVIAALNSCGKFTPIRFKFREIGKKTLEATVTKWVDNQKTREKIKVDIVDRGCIAYATDKATGETLEGPEVTMEMAVMEGWYTKTDSKWKTMPDMMMRYRSAKFFGGLYAPEILMGMGTVDEAEDIAPEPPKDVTPSGPAPAMAAPRSEPRSAPGSEPHAEAPQAPANDNAAPAEPAKRTRKPAAAKPDAAPQPPVIDSTATEIKDEAPAPAIAKPTAPAPAAAPARDLF